MIVPTFSKQHFEFIADVLSRSRRAVQRTGDSHVLAQFDIMFVPEIADDLATTNTKFNRERFIAACGVKESPP